MKHKLCLGVAFAALLACSEKGVKSAFMEEIEAADKAIASCLKESHDHLLGATLCSTTALMELTAYWQEHQAQLRALPVGEQEEIASAFEAVAKKAEGAFEVENPGGR